MDINLANKMSVDLSESLITMTKRKCRHFLALQEAVELPELYALTSVSSSLPSPVVAISSLPQNFLMGCE